MKATGDTSTGTTSDRRARVPSDLPVWRDELLGNGAQVVLQQVPDINAGSLVLDEKHSRPGWGPLQAGDGVALGAVAPLQEGLLRRQLVQPDAPVTAAGLGGGTVGHASTQSQWPGKLFRTLAF